MGYSTYLNNKTLDSSVTDFIKKFNNGGLNRKSYDQLVSDSTARAIPSTIVVKFAGGMFDKLDGTIKKDGNITIEELDEYLKKYYNASIYDFEGQKMSDLVAYIEKIDNGAKNVQKPTIQTYDGRDVGIEMYEAVKGWGTSDNLYPALRDKTNKDNVVEIIDTFNRRSKDLHIMSYFADDGVHQGIASRVPKALLRKAIELNLTDTSEYKELAEFYGAKGTPAYNSSGAISSKDNFTLTKHCSDDVELSDADGKKIDRMMERLMVAIEDAESAISQDPSLLDFFSVF